MIYDRSVSTVTENGKRITLIGLTLPLLTEYIFLQLYSTVNTVILSGYSDMAVSATGVSQQVSSLATVILDMINKGVVIVSSVALGSQDKERARSLAGTGSVMAIGMSLLLAAVLNTLSVRFMEIMGLTGQLQSMGAEYLGIVAMYLPVTALLSYVNNLLICHGYSRITMISGLLSNGINLLLCYLALYSGLKLPISGVAAVAVCRGIAQLLGLGVSVFFFFKKKCLFRLGFNGKAAWSILKFGAPAGMSMLSYSLSQTVTTGFITGLGVAVINTKLYVSNILAYTNKVSYALGNAGGILMGRHRGAHRMDSVRQLYRQNLLIAVSCNMTIALLVLLLHRQLLYIFTSDPDIIRAGGTIMAVDLAVELFRAVNHISENAFNANGDVKTPLVTAAVSAWGCNVLLSYILAVQLRLGLTGLWLAMAADELFKAAVYLLRWRSGKWQNVHV